MSTWKPDSWQTKPCVQQPTYADQNKLASITATLATLPPLVTVYEVEALKQQIAEAANGKRFILQGGDCAESFANCQSTPILNKVKILLQMSLVLLYGMRKPITRIGRIAGQYAKPRSAEYETRDGITLPSYRGDIINNTPFTEQDRMPCPDKLLQGYYNSALTLNYIRSLVNSGFADLNHPEYWELDFFNKSEKAKQFKRYAETIIDSLDFLQSIPGTEALELNRVEFYTSHEALHLLYEQSLTRQIEKSWYNLSTHLPWIGMRTAKIEQGHVEYFKGIANPIGIKIGPSMTDAWLRELVETLNPTNEEGRLLLIHRFSAQNIADKLPKMIDSVKATGVKVAWSCDPMHGNTKTTPSGIKTRNFDDILHELKQAFDIHEQNDSALAGVHFELTGEKVTECLGGSSGLTEEDLKNAYESLVDPRLNYEQALEMAMLIAQR